MNRKLPLAIIIILAFMLILSLTGCFGNQVTISFDTMGGDSAFSVGVDVSATSITLPTPTKEGYQFDYWCYDADCSQRVDTSIIPKEDAIFYAKWSPKLITITFLSTHPVSNEISRQYKYVSYGENLAVADMPTIKDVDGFDAIWLTNDLVAVNAPLTIYSRYSEKKNFVKYYVDGEEYSAFNGVAQTAITPPETPIKDGFYFAGWYFDNEYSTRSKDIITKIPSQSVSLYAKFIDISESSRFFTYTSVGGNVKITGLTTVGKAQSELVVPRVINNNNVTSIGYSNDNSSAQSLSVFGNTNLQRILIPSTVEIIGSFAFYGSSYLKEVIFEDDGLISLGTGAFANCPQLTEFDLSSSVTSIGKYCFAGMAVSENTNNNLIFSDEGSWSTVNNWVKTGMNFATINIKNNSLLSTINNYAFFNLSNFTSIILPKNLGSVNYLAFADSGLSSVSTYVGGSFITEQGAVYSSDGKTLVYYPLCGPATFTVKTGTNAIASYAFYNNKNVTTVSANSSLLSIGQYAFYNCTSLLNFNYSGNTVFTSIGAYAFSKSKIGIFAAPPSLSTLGVGVFKDATSLTTITFNGGTLTTIPQEAFSNCTSLSGIIVPNTVSTIGKHAFYNCAGLFLLSFEENSILNTIDDYAFTNCVNIATIAFPSTLRNINQYAFAGNSGKMNLDLSAIPSEITSLGDYAFSNTKIANFSINSNLRSLGKGVFKNCISLSRFTITVSDYITAIPDDMFYGCTLLNQVNFPYTILHIGNYSFYNCSKLTDLTFNLSAQNNGLLTIGSSAFQGCTLLKSGESTKRILPITLTTVGTKAFYGCTTLTKIYIPKALTYLSSEAFAYCSSLTEINYDTNGTLNTIGENAFAYCTALVSARLPSALLARNDLDTEGCIKNPFIGCNKLVSFMLTDNPAFYILDGILYRNLTSGKQIYLYPTGKSATFAVGTDITSIDRYAFYGTSVSSISFTNNTPIGGVETINLVKIGAYAFSHSLINSAIISKRVYSIEENAFSFSSLNALSIDATVVASSNGSYNIANPDIISNTLSIGESAFKSTAITYFTAPERLTNIKTGAFSECYHLQNLTFANSVTFSLEIGDYAFYGDSSITNLVLPWQLYLLGDYAFSNCFNMQNINFSYLGSLNIELAIGAYAFSNNQYLYTAVLPPHLTEMGEGVFSYNSRLSVIDFSATINSSSLTIPKLAFFGANSLKSIEVPAYVSEIGEKAFWKTNLESVTLNNGVDLVIGSHAFSEITKLKTIFLPQNVTTIGEYAFFNTALTSFTYASSGKNIDILGYAFCGTNLTTVELNTRFVSLNNNAFANTLSLISANIYGGISAIGASAFESSKLSTLTLDNNVKTIGASAFAYTSNLEGISGCFTNIGDYAFNHSGIAFYDCQSTLDSITIGIRSFANCNNLLAITLQVLGSVSIDDFAFSESNKLNTLSISGSFATIGLGIAYNDVSLESINITDALDNYYCESGVLYNRNGTLVQYPAGKLDANCTLLAEINAIGDYAFFGNKNLLSIILSSDILINKVDSAFASTNNNLKIYVPENLVTQYKEQWNISNVSFITTQLNGLVLKYLGNDYYSIIDYAGSATTLIIEGSISITLNDNLVTYRIIQIEEYAFANNTVLTNITIGSGLQTIYNYAFANCTSLQTLVIGDNVLSIKNYAFANCTSLNSATFGSNLDNIGNYAFVNCNVLDNVVLPNNLTFIGDYAFSYATTLSNIVLGNSLQSLGNNCFEYNLNLISITLPASLKTINDNVFYKCEKLTFLYVLSVQAPSLKSENAFKNTSDSILFFVNANSKNYYKGDRLWRTYSSKIMSISDICTVENFNNYVLQNISGNNYRLLGYLGVEENVTIISNITSQIKITEIGGYAISHFTKTITLSEGITALSNYAFANASGLLQITLPSSLISIGKNCFTNLKLLQNVNINDFDNSKLSVISDYAFYNTIAITSFAFPKKLASIGNYAFAKIDANMLSIVTFLSPSVNSISIGSYAFSNNNILKTITFECVVSVLGEGAFSNCNNLEAIYFNSVGTNATTIAPTATKVFENCNKLSVFVSSENVYNNFRSVWQNTFDKNKLCIKSFIAKDTEDLIGQNGFVISIIPGSVTTASIINYLGTDTVVTFPSKITVNSIAYTITKIGRDESSSTQINGYVIGSNVTKVIVPASVSSIGTDAFRNSQSLQTVEFPVDSSLTTIGKNAFSGCGKLKTINIPKTITSISSYAFANCTSLTNITFANLPAYDPTSLDIKEYAFSNCTALVSTTLPLHTRTLGVYAFSGATSLATIVITEECKLLTLGEYAFKDTAIASIYLPATVTNVANYCFTNCTKLRYIYVNREISGNSSLTSAGALIFDKNASPFIKIYVPLTSYTSYLDATGWNTKTVIPNLKSGDYNYLINAVGNNTITLTNYLGSSTTLNIPSAIEINSISYRVTAINKYIGNDKIKKVVFDANNYVTVLNKYAFASCSSLEKIHLPNNIVTIEEYAFYSCTALKDIILPEQLANIQDFTFANCTSLTEIRIPAFVLGLGNSAFMSCTSLNRLIINSTEPRALGVNALQQTPTTMKIVVLGSLINLFSTEWAAYRTRLVGKEFMLGDFIVAQNNTGYTLVQYNGKADIDLTSLTFFGAKITEIAEGSIIDKNIKIKLESSVTYNAELANQVVILD